MEHELKQSEPHDVQKTLTELLLSVQVLKCEVTALLALAEEIARSAKVENLDGLSVLAYFVRQRAAELEAALRDFEVVEPGFAARLRKVVNQSKDEYPTL